MAAGTGRLGRAGRLGAVGVLALAVAGAVSAPAAAARPVAVAHPVAAAPADTAARPTGEPVPPGVARRLAALARSAWSGAGTPSPRPPVVRPIPDTNLSTDLPTRLVVQEPFLEVPFTIVAPANTYRRPLVVVELFGETQVLVAAGFYGARGQTRYEGVVVLDTTTIRSYGEALWVFGVFADADESEDVGEIAVLPTTLKVRSLLGQRVTRSGDTVRVFGSAKAYDPSTSEDFDDGFRPRVGQTVYLQRYTTSGWTTLRTLRTDTRGHVDVSLRIPFRAGLRLTTRDTATTFGATTPQAIS